VGDIVKAVKGGRFIGWYVRYKDIDGKRKQRASHQPTRELARRYLLAVEGRVARGLVGIAEPTPPAPAVAKLVERFLVEYSRPRIKDLAQYRRYARTALYRALPHIGNLPGDAVTSAEVARLREALLRRGAENSVRLTLTVLGTLFSWAQRQGIVSNNPCRGVELPPRKDAIEYLTQDEARALLATAEQRAATGTIVDRCLRAAVCFVLHTGLRKGEVAALRWRDLDLTTRRLTVSRSFTGAPKSGKARHLHLPDAVVPILQTWQASCPPTAAGLVFPRRLRDGSFEMMKDSRDMFGLPGLFAAAGLRPIGRAWHALRHTMASHYIMQGGSLLALSKILGHVDLKMTMIYAHLSPDFIGSEMNRLKY
jgi:integrase